MHYNIVNSKPKLIEFINSNYDDFCSDMMKDIAAFARKESLDDVISFITMIQQANEVREKQIKVIHNACCLSEILAIANDDIVGNVLYEQEDRILSVLFGVEIKEIF